MFSPAPEIHAYLEHCVSKHGLSQFMKLSHRVIGAVWDESVHQWKVDVQNTSTNEVTHDSCDFLINASGILNNWKWPEINGLFDFRGKLVHSADWPEEWNYEGLRVAVIGNGSSGVQIVPAMQPDVKELIHLTRSPTWITPPGAKIYAALLGQPIPDVFSEEQKKLFREDEAAYLDFRMEIERGVNKRFPLLLSGSDTQEAAIKMARANMLDLLGPIVNPETADSIIPKFPVGCRRITPGSGYLESFSKSNLRVITNAKIDHVNEKGIVMENGEHIEVDAIVAATGFDVSFMPRFPIVGQDGIRLSDVWSEPNTPRAYLSTCIPNFPNYFGRLISSRTPERIYMGNWHANKIAVILGPNAPIAHGSVLTVTEHCSKYILQLITKAQTEGILAYSVKQEACDDFHTHVNTFMPRTTWAAECRSWFKGGKVNGPVTAVHPGSRVHWFHMIERPKYEDFNYTYETANRFSYLGNGFSSREVDEDGDSTWFLTDKTWKFLYY